MDELQERITAAVNSVTPDMQQRVWSVGSAACRTVNGFKRLARRVLRMKEDKNIVVVFFLLGDSLASEFRRQGIKTNSSLNLPLSP